jgi:hypothetical protein
MPRSISPPQRVQAPHPAPPYLGPCPSISPAVHDIHCPELVFLVGVLLAVDADCGKAQWAAQDRVRLVPLSHLANPDRVAVIRILVIKISGSGV